MGAIEKPLVPTRHRLSVDDYYRMAEAGVFAPEARVELIEGELIDMAAVGTRHAAAVARLNRVAHAAVGDRAIVQVQNPMRLGDFSEPEPDLLLLQPRDDFYATAHPTPDDVLLLVEVADTSARYDREVKLPLYARHGVSEVWVVDLDAKLLRFFRKPVDGAYTDITASETPGATPVAALPGVTIDLRGLLG